MSITVRNKLEIKPGNVISVPGCEPVSALTSIGLLRSLHCNASVISVKKVLQLIPGSRVVRVTSPHGQNGTGSWVELPFGPPPDGDECPQCLVDWYKLLKENAEVPPQEETPFDGPCAGFNYSGCARPAEADYAHGMRRTPDPAMRPNGMPLSP